MSALKCLACQHENKVEDKFCEACGSSLDLRFCPACEAVNGRGATHCHSCSTALPADAPKETAAPEAQFRPPLRWRVIEVDRSPARQAMVVTGRTLLALSLVALGALAYHFYGEWSPAAKAAAAAAAPAAGASVAPRTEPPAPAPAPVAAVPAEPIKPKVAPAPASAPKRAAPEPKQVRRASGVTHLRGAAPAPAIAAPEPQEKTVTPAPPPAAAPSSPPAAAPSYARVTHTRPGTAAPVVEATPAASPKSAAAAACPETVAALGLCSANVKREGN